MVEHIQKLNARCAADSNGSFEREVRTVLAEGNKSSLAAAGLTAAVGYIQRIVAIFYGGGA